MAERNRDGAFDQRVGHHSAFDRRDARRVSDAARRANCIAGVIKQRYDLTNATRGNTIMKSILLAATILAAASAPAAARLQLSIGVGGIDLHLLRRSAQSAT